MRKIFLLLSLCVSVCLFAADGKPTTQKRKSALSELMMQNQKSESKKPAATKLSLEEVRRSVNAEIAAKANQDATSLRKSVADDMYLRLDSMTVTDAEGKLSGVSKFTYNDDFSDATQTIIAPNWETGELMTSEVISMEYTDKGDLSSKTTFSYGVENGMIITNGDRLQYFYDSERRLTEQILSFYSRVFIPDSKITYVYDDRGYAVDIFSSNFIDGVWVNAMRSVADFDDQGREILMLDYEWNGNDWVPQEGDAKREFKYDSGGRLCYTESFRWNAGKNDWDKYHIWEDIFNEDGLIMMQKESFWNEADQDWTGYVMDPGTEWEETLYTNKAVFEYNDPNNKETYQMYSKLIDGVWVDFYSIEHTYDYNVGLNAESGKEIPEGGYQATKLGFNHETGSKVEDTKYISIYGTINIKPCYQKEWKKHGTTWRSLYENEYDYYGPGETNYNGEEWEFTKDEANIRYAALKQVVDLDDNNLPVESFHYQGVFYSGNSDVPSEEWIPTARFEYKHTAEGIRCENIRYVYEEGEYIFDFKDSDIIDYTVPVTEMVVPSVYGSEYKIVSTHSSTRWDFYADRTYYYSEVPKGGSSIKGQTTDKFVVYPNPTIDFVNITATEDVQVNIYNLQGATILKSTDKSINVSTLAPGYYIIDVNGVKTKLIKK